MPDIRGSKKPIPTKNKMNAPINNINSMPSFNSEEAFLLPEDKYISSPNISFSMQSPTIPSAIPPQSMPQQNVIRNAGLQTIPQEPVSSSEDDTNFLGSLIAQGVAGIGTGLMGGTPRDIANSANMFQYMRDQQTKRNKSDLLMDPKSEESKKRRLVFKNLGYDVPEDLSYTDLGDSDVLRSLRSRQMEQPKLAGSTRQGGVSGVGKGKEEKESKDQSTTNKYTAEADSLKNQLIKYKKAVKAIPPLGGAAQIANAEALQKDILLTIKNIKETGSLDAGSIGVIEGMIGTPDYTRDEIVDSTINTSLENLNAAVESKLRGTGTKNTKYTPYIPIQNPTPQEEEIIKNYYSDPNDPDSLKMYQDLRTKKGF